MALRFPKKKVMLDVVDGGLSHPVVIESDGWKVLRATSAQMEDYECCRSINRRLNDLLHAAEAAAGEAADTPAADEPVAVIDLPQAQSA